MLRRALVAALASASLLIPAHVAVAEQANEVPNRVCEYDWREGTWHIKQLIKCAARRWDSPGTPTKAVEVARCESNLNPTPTQWERRAFQHAVRYWPTAPTASGSP
jgi:hypothetical protein